jgi:signal transduction histidine kinase
MKPLLNHLRIRLVLLYTAIGISLAVLLSVGTYTLVNYYLRTNNDRALTLKMGLQFASLHLPLPIDLYEPLLDAGFIKQSADSQYFIDPSGHAETEDENEEGEAQDDQEYNETSAVEISELADIMVLSLTIDGTPITGTVVTHSWLPADKAAITAALVKGSDIRTVKLTDGTPVRLLTYRVPVTNEVGLIQVGRSLKPQQAMMDELLQGMILIGVVSILLLGLGSWFLAGRSIKPTQLAWERQQTFVAHASHELRTPLTLIHAGVEVAQRQSTSEPQKQVLEDVLSDANYMTKLIENLLLLSRLDAHKLPIEIQPVLLSGLLDELIRQNERVLSGKEIALSSEGDPLIVLADPVRLKQILLILIDNAARNNHSGGWIKIRTSSKLGKVEIEVSDSGDGIAPEHLAKIFDRFYKVTDKSTQDYHGSGLGLSIAQGLVQAQNGTIEVTSKLGEGTQVRFTLPLAKKPTHA